MAGRPLGLRSLMKALSRYSRAQLEKLIASVPTQSDVVARLERQREKLAKAMTKLDRQIAKMSGGNGSVAAPAAKLGRKPGRKKGYKLSPATRAKMRAAALLRYGKAKPTAAPAEPKKKRKFSPEARAKMAAAAKARWAKKKGAEGPKVENNA